MYTLYQKKYTPFPYKCLHFSDHGKTNKQKNALAPLKCKKKAPY